MDMEELLKKKVKGNIKKVKMKKTSIDASYCKNENIPFKERYTPITTYIRKDLNHRMREINKIGEVKSITSFINAAISNQLKKY